MTVRLPDRFVSIKYPGYFWNLDEQVLYSLKPSGILRPMKVAKPNRWNKYYQPLYEVSFEGKRKYINVETLKKTVDSDSVIPVEARNS